MASPAISVTSTPTLPTDPVVVSVHDADSNLDSFLLTCQDHTNGAKYVIYDHESGLFFHPFGGRSTISGAGTSGSPYIVTVYRRGGWPTNIALDVKIYAIDNTGNEVEA